MALIQEKSTSFFILDTRFIVFNTLTAVSHSKTSFFICRPSADYNDSRMNLPNSVNIPEEILSPGITAASLGRKLPVHVSFLKVSDLSSLANLLLLLFSCK